MNRKTIISSIILKSVLLVFVIVGIIINIMFGIIGGAKTLLYFTTQSNIWIGLIDMVMIILLIKTLKDENFKIHNAFYIIQQVCTVAIALTGVVYCFFLAPAAGMKDPHVFDQFRPYFVPAIILHVIVPILAVVDFFLYTHQAIYKKLDAFYAIIPPIYYFFFALIGYFMNWDFKDGNNFPYFFMNYASPAGIFGFSSEMPYFMGTFYWDIIICGIVIGFSFLIIYLDNKIINKNKN